MAISAAAVPIPEFVQLSKVCPLRKETKYERYDFQHGDIR
jgi:hypothetical protein